MAVLGSILFKRTLKKFLNCEDLESVKGKALTEKIRQTARDSLEHLIQAIPNTSGLHHEILKEICRENIEPGTEELFLGSLDDTHTNIRSTAASILSRSTQISPSKLFHKLHQSDVSRSEIIDILEFQRKNLKPEQIIGNALKLAGADAERLLKLAGDSEIPLNLEALNIDPASINSPNMKIILLRYFSQVDQPEIARAIARFLSDSNKTIFMEALKALKSLNFKFDPSPLLPFIESMSDIEREIAAEILQAQADAEMVSKFAPWVVDKSDKTREMLIKLVVEHVTEQGLEKFLGKLDKQEWWGKDQALKCLHSHANNKLASAASGLSGHENEFIRSNAQQFAAKSGNTTNLEAVWNNALHENWQVREVAIGVVGKSAKRESIPLLNKVLTKYPESAVAIMKAASELGFTKGLEICFLCLKMPEAQIQREALESIGKLAKERHAELVREKLMAAVPRLQVTVRDTAGQVVKHLTEEFKLSELQIDHDEYFDTRLIKIDETQALSSNATVEPFKPVQAANIESFIKGDMWLDRYKIDKEIGRGAMGRVMLARDEMVGENVILKFMHPELTADEDSRERFMREVKYSRKISHPNVIRIHDMLSKDELSAISMEFFESEGIDVILRKKKYFEPREGLEILLQVSDGMAAAHNQDVIHRDLKPSNILMDNTGLVKVVDFGIASASNSKNTEEALTQVGSIIGTPAYISPERARGREADRRCDIYALGIIAYSLLCGELPYRGEPMALLFQHIKGNAKPLQEVKESVGAAPSKLIQKMMAVKQKDRFQTMEDVSAAIRQTLKDLG